MSQVVDKWTYVRNELQQKGFKISVVENQLTNFL